MIRLFQSTALVAATVLAFGAAGAQGTGAAATHPGTLATSPDQQLGLKVASPTQRTAAFAAADAVMAILRRDAALAAPVGYAVGLRRVAGISETTPGGQPIDGSLHFGVTGSMVYYVTEDDGHGGTKFDSRGDIVPFSVVVNAPGGLTDAEELRTELDNGPSVLGHVRQTGTFRGHPIYNGNCVVISGRPIAPFVPLTMERYSRLVILGYRADSASNAERQRQSAATQASEDAKNNSSAEKAKRDANTKATYEAIKKMDPASAEQFLQATRQAEAQMQAAMNDPSVRQGDSAVAELVRRAPIEEGKHLQELQAKLDAMSAADRRVPVAVIIHGPSWDFHSDELYDINDPESSPLVQLNPAFFDRSRPVTAPQIITVCIPGIQGLENKSYEMYAGDEREQDRVKLEHRTRDVVQIRDHLDWAALEALVKP